MSSTFTPPPPPQQPANPLAKAINEALSLHQRGDLGGAEKAYKRVLQTWPNQFDALHLYGMLNFQRGKFDDALKLIGQAVKIEPRSADAHSNLGMVLATLKRSNEAMASFDKAVALEPNNIGALINRGRALLEAGHAEEGLASIDKALARDPRHLEGRINRGNALLALKRRDEALREYDQVIAQAPGHSGAHFNRGNALLEMLRPAEAFEAFQRAAGINGSNERVWNARGVALQALRDHAQAAQSFERAISLRKDFADAHFNLALSLLTLGDYARGFSEYEWRWVRTGMPRLRSFKKPVWNGVEPLAGKTLFLHAEQGLGDTVQFARYVPQLADMGARVVLEVQAELLTLLASLNGAAEVIARGEAEPDYDLHCPLGSLPLAFKTELTSVPAPIPYLQASADRVEKWRARLGSDAPRIALAWAGNAAHVNDRNRSIPLAALKPLLSGPSTFVSLQVDPRDEDATVLGSVPNLLHLGGEISDFADTAAILSLCDLVISVDTSVAHVAGAMGRPLWMLIPFAPDWRWTLDAQSPWYPDAQLFRQRQASEWQTVIADVRSALAQRS